MIVSSKICGVEMMGKPSRVMNADLSVVCLNGKYGLMYIGSHENAGAEDAELTVPAEYDNLTFIEIGYISYLLAVSAGKQGLFSFEGCSKGDVENVVAVELLPCVYDYIEPGRNKDVIFLHSNGLIHCYSMDEKRIICSCEHIEEPCMNYLLCISGETAELWNTNALRRVVTLETYTNVSYLGTYEQGDVFHLEYLDDTTDSFLYQHQLLFCEYEGQGFHFGPKTSGLSVHKIEEYGECRVVGVEMTCGDWKRPLSIETVNEITGEKHSFE